MLCVEQLHRNNSDATNLRALAYRDWDLREADHQSKQSGVNRSSSLVFGMQYMFGCSF